VQSTVVSRVIQPTDPSFLHVRSLELPLLHCFVGSSVCAWYRGAVDWKPTQHPQISYQLIPKETMRSQGAGYRVTGCLNVLMTAMGFHAPILNKERLIDHDLEGCSRSSQSHA
jgi:hypothetical protein